MTQRRWFCQTCEREWIWPLENIVGVYPPWDPSQGCPGCHSPKIGEIEYKPAFPGADIPRDEAGRPTAGLPPHGLPIVPEVRTMPTAEPALALASAASDDDVDDRWTRL